MGFVHALIDSVTMYRLVLYGLTALAALAIAFGFSGLVSYDGTTLLLSLAILLASCFAVNFAFAKFYGAPANPESSFITAFILFFLMPPAFTALGAAWLALAGAAAIASKYVIAWKNQHLFNPAAFGAFLVGLVGGGGAIWWVGSAAMLPAVALVGFLVVAKVRRFALFFACVFASLVPLALLASPGTSVTELLARHFLSWPIVFFAAIMVTEPLTTPPTKRLQLIYGALVGALSSVPFSIGGLIYSSPELALLIGNLFSYAFSLKRRLTLVLAEKAEIARDTYEFVFRPDHAFAFAAGQYLEWTLPHPKPDQRGTRRYFTIASSPTEETVRVGVRVNPAASGSFKKGLLGLKPGDSLSAAQLAGDFILPKDRNEKLVFVAGGIGITPFRSQLGYLKDTNERRDIILFYANKHPEEVAYREFLDEVEQKLGIRTVYLFAEGGTLSGHLNEQGFLTAALLEKHVPDWKERTFYLSGPHPMVESYKKLLRGMGVPRRKIVTDYFPGYA